MLKNYSTKIDKKYEEIINLPPYLTIAVNIFNT
jgi:hypothetical protein